MATLAVLAGIYLMLGSNPVVAAGDNVSVYYTGSYANGTVFDSNMGNGKPLLQFIVGTGQVIKGFDQAVVGMKINDVKNVTITPDLGYGYVNRSLIISVSLRQFGNQTVHVGQIVTRVVTTGQQFQGVVIAVNATNATINFNPPLAGKTLVFQIKMVKIQKKH